MGGLHRSHSRVAAVEGSSRPTAACGSSGGRRRRKRSVPRPSSPASSVPRRAHRPARGLHRRVRPTVAQYAQLTAAADGDLDALWAARATRSGRSLEQMKTAWVEGNPAYERMEGVVAGTPSLAEYDVIIDAGSSAAEDPESAVPFDLTLADGTVLEAAREPLQPDRGRALGDAAGGARPRGHAGRPGRRRRGRVRRGPPRPAPAPGGERAVRPVRKELDPPARHGSRPRPTLSRPSS